MWGPRMIKPADPPDTPEQPNTSADPSLEVLKLLNEPNILQQKLAHFANAELAVVAFPDDMCVREDGRNGRHEGRSAVHLLL